MNVKENSEEQQKQHHASTGTRSMLAICKLLSLSLRQANSPILNTELLQLILIRYIELKVVINKTR